MSNKEQLTFEAIAIKGDAGYASDYNRNGLFKVNMSTGECEFVGLFAGEPFDGKRLHCAAVWIDSKIYFIPGSGNKIDVFYPEDNSIESIKIPFPKPKQFPFYRAQFKFIRVIKNEDDLWLLPCSYPGIIKLDTRSGNIQIFDQWLEEDEYFFRIGIDVDDKKIVMANGKSNAVLIFDMEKEVGEIKHIGSRNHGVMSICKSEDIYWLAPRLPGAIVAWDPVKDTVIEYNELPSEFEAGNIVFSNVYSVLDKIIFIPAKSNNGLVYDNGNICIYNLESLKKYSQSGIEYLFETNTERYFREIKSDGGNRYIKISKSDNTVSEYSFSYLDNGERERFRLSVMSANHEIVKETQGFGLKELIRGFI